MAKAIDVADEIIVISNKKGKTINRIKLENVMYFLNVLSLLDRKKPLITDVKFIKVLESGVLVDNLSDTIYGYDEYTNINEVPIHHNIYVDNNGEFKDDKYVFNEDKMLSEYHDDVIFIKDNIDKFINFSEKELVKYCVEEDQLGDTDEIYFDDKLSYEYYSKPKHQFWNIMDNNIRKVIAVKKPIKVKAYQADKEMVIHTLEGDMVAHKGDWIMEGVEGEHWAIKDDIFHKTYDIVEEIDN